MRDNSKNTAACQTIPLFAVYVLWCRCTNQFYVGVTGRKVENRICEHKRKKHQYIDREIQRLGWENFDWWVVEEHVPSEQISEREQYWVDFFGSVYPKGYNKTRGGIKFFKHTEETKAQMRSRRHTEEEKAKIAKGNSGKKRTEEQRANIRKSHLGKKLSKEQATKIGNGNRGKRRTEEFKETIRQARLGKKHTEESKALMRTKALARNIGGKNHPMYGKHHTEETKAKIREKALARHAAKRVAKAVSEENLAAANTTPTNLSTLLDAVILQKCLRSKIFVA